LKTPITLIEPKHAIQQHTRRIAEADDLPSQRRGCQSATNDRRSQNLHKRSAANDETRQESRHELREELDRLENGHSSSAERTTVGIKGLRITDL